MNFREDVLFTGHLIQNELVRVVASAEVLTYLSYFEGFGLPVLEAMKSGTAVLCAELTSIPEVGGNAVQYCDVHSVDDIVAKLYQLVSDNSFRQGQIEKGFIQAEKFSWDKSAEQVSMLLNRLLDKK